MNYINQGQVCVILAMAVLLDWDWVSCSCVHDWVLSSTV